MATDAHPSAQVRKDVHDLIRAGDLDGLDALCRSRGLWILRAAPNGETMAHVAAAVGRVDALAWLNARGEPIDAADSEGQTPLMAATRAGRAPAVRWLLAHGADPRKRLVRERYLNDAPGMTSAMICLHHYEVGEATALPSDPAQDMFGLLLTHLGDADLATTDDAGMTLALHAAKSNQLAAYLWVHGRRPDPDAVDAHGHTALYWAWEHGNRALAQHLLALGANPEYAVLLRPEIDMAWVDTCRAPVTPPRCTRDVAQATLASVQYARRGRLNP
jgi:hypothetical protein